MKTLKEKIVEILREVDELHTDGFALPEYLDKLAAKLLSLISQDREELCGKLEKKFNSLLRQSGAYDKSGNALDWFDKDDILQALSLLKNQVKH